MSRLHKQLTIARADRDAARGALDTRIAQVRADLDSRGIGARIADRIGQDARDIADEAVDMASEHRGAIAGTIVAMAVWIFRNPILAWIEGLMDQETR